LHPLKSSAFHGALLRQLTKLLFDRRLIPAPRHSYSDVHQIEFANLTRMYSSTG
jgi:hypothetical protein